MSQTWKFFEITFHNGQILCTAIISLLLQTYNLFGNNEEKYFVQVQVEVQASLHIKIENLQHNDVVVGSI